jgi:hypothetical protein
MMNSLLRPLALMLALVAAPAAAQQERVVYRIPVTGTVEMGLAPYVERALEEAAKAGAAAAVLDLDTPGGRVDAAERISDAIADSPIPTYAWVNRRAFSAGRPDRALHRPGVHAPRLGDGRRHPGDRRRRPRAREDRQRHALRVPRPGRSARAGPPRRRGHGRRGDRDPRAWWSAESCCR